MPIAHVVWDWNGTLLDDLEIVLEAVSVAIEPFGLGPMTEDLYRDHFTRPVRAFYDSLFGRPISDMEWADMNKVFHDEYFARVDRANLTADALAAIDLASSIGMGQSLLSMTTHDRLVDIVGRHGISDRFVRIDGLPGETGGLKAEHLARHLHRMAIEPAETIVIGDTPDDADAADRVGARAVLYDGGSHHLPLLGMTGAPIAHDLVSAIGMIT